jgi:hypothetical protein
VSLVFTFFGADQVRRTSTTTAKLLSHRIIICPWKIVRSAEIIEPAAICCFTYQQCRTRYRVVCIATRRQFSSVYAWVDHTDLSSSWLSLSLKIKSEQTTRPGTCSSPKQRGHQDGGVWVLLHAEWLSFSGPYLTSELFFSLESNDYPFMGTRRTWLTTSIGRRL